MNSLELRQKRAGVLTQARTLYDERANGEGLMAEDEQQWRKLMDEADRLKGQYETLERLEAEERDLQQRMGRQPNKPEPNGGQGYQFVSRGMRMANEASGNDLADQPVWKGLFRSMSPQYGQEFGRFLRSGQSGHEMRSLQADSDTLGGYLVTPMQFVDQLIKAVDDAVYIRQWATVFAVPNAESLGVPTLESDPADADWTSELGTGNEDGSMGFGKRALHPHPLAKRIKVSNKLIMKAPNSEGLVRDRLAYKFGITYEKAALTGSGSGQPLGVFTASSDGIGTGRDISTGNSTTAIAFDNLITVKYTLKAQYWARARWLFHRDAMAQIAKLKDGNSNYIWRESVRVGEPDRLLGLPVFMSEYAPNTFSASQYVGILGDFSHYWIADSMAFTLQRLAELYAETNQTGMIGRLESDGMPTLAEAFVRVQLAAS